jgi:L-rhamnose mutarotase
MKRYGSVIQLNPELIESYKHLHANAWPQVLATITACNIRNYSIFIFGNTLFSYFEYAGDDYEGDMAKMGEDKVTQAWWAVCKPMQVPVAEAGTDEWWHDLEEVFHLD